MDIRKNRRAYQRPVIPREHDNDLTRLLKLIKREFHYFEGGLPRADYLKEYLQEPSGGDIITNPSVIDIGTGTRTGIVMPFTVDRDESSLTPVENFDPTPQQIMQGLGFTFLTPVWEDTNDRFITPWGVLDAGRDIVEPMGGTVFRVDSDNDYCCLIESGRIFPQTAGTLSMWVQGLHDGDDGDRNYYILDIGNKFILYYEYENGVTSRLVWYPNTDYTFCLTVNIADDDNGWFGFGPHKITVIWDFSTQTFELLYDKTRASEIPYERIEMPFLSTLPLVLGNSHVNSSANGGLENTFQHLDDIKISYLSPGLFEITSVDGNVAQTLLPVHSGTFFPGISDDDPATPINLGREIEPFDHLYCRHLHYTTLTPSTDQNIWEEINADVGLSSFPASPHSVLNFTGSTNHIKTALSPAFGGVTNILSVAFSLDDAIIVTNSVQAGTDDDEGFFILGDGSGQHINITPITPCSDYTIYLPDDVPRDQSLLTMDESGYLNYYSLPVFHETWMDLRALSTTGIFNGLWATGAFATNVLLDAARQVTFLVTALSGTCAGTLRITGLNAQGDTVTEDFVINVAAPGNQSGTTNAAFIRVSASGIGASGTGTLIIGWNDIIGLAQPIVATGDVIAYKKNTVGTTIPTVNATYSTISFSVISAGDDFEVWYKPGR